MTNKLLFWPLVTTNNNLSFKINVVDITFFFETFFFLLNISLETFEWYNFHFWDHIFLLTFTLLSPQNIFKFSWIFFNYRSSLNKLHLSTTKLKKKTKKKKNCTFRSNNENDTVFWFTINSKEWRSNNQTTSLFSFHYFWNSFHIPHLILLTIVALSLSP